MQRTPYWLIDGGMLIDLLAIPALGIFFYGWYLHYKKIKSGSIHLNISIDLIKSMLQKIQFRSLLINGVIGVRTYKKPITGLFHGLMFWGMLVLLMGTILIIFNLIFGMPVFSGSFYRRFMAFGLDLAGLTVMAGVSFLLIRRVSGFQRLISPKARNGFVFVEVSLLAVLITGFLLEASRIRLAGVDEPAFVGYFISHLFGATGEGQGLYVLLWWLHGGLALAFIAYIPYSPLTHFIFIPLNAALANPIMGADNRAADMDDLAANPDGELPTLGTPTLKDYSSKQLFDFSTCLWCGRCQEVCPATQTDKKLSPKSVMTTLAEQLFTAEDTDKDLIEIVGMETVYECRTCGACVQVCPAMTNPLKTIWSMRQNLVMERGEMPTHMLSAYRNLEALHHPFSSSASPSDWRKGLTVPTFKAGETEYLLWIGCAITYEDRAQQIGRAMVNILNQTDISYGIIEEARCTGDPAKQLGDDYLFSMLAGINIDLFNAYGVKKIITMCPHCYNSFKTYYPPLGVQYELIPHAQLIRDCIRSGEITVANNRQDITYHDPCYLGRHNTVFNAPREIINSVGDLKEMPRNSTESFCCGAGGGNYWNEEEGTRISNTRAEEAHNSGAKKLASSCPFCLLMLTDGIKEFTENEVVYDIAELVEQQLNADDD